MPLLRDGVGNFVRQSDALLELKSTMESFA